MMKKTVIFSVLMASMLASSMSNASDILVNGGIEKLVPTKGITRTEQRLLSDMNGVVEEARINESLKTELSEISVSRASFDMYGETENPFALLNWTLRCRSLTVLSKLDDKTAATTLESDMDYLKRRLPNASLYYHPSAYPQALVGIWEQLAVFDPTSRKSLISTYETGDNKFVPKNTDRASLWASLKD